MSNISFTAHGRCARATVCEPITTGSVGLSVSFAFDAAWSGLQKTAIFLGSGMAVDLVLSGDAATVPPEVLTIPGGDLRVGVWGADPDGNVIIPTVWATVGEIVPGAAPSGFDPDPPTPSWAAQVQEIAQDALNTANSVREDADVGAFDGATYTPAVSAGGDLSWTNDKGKPNPPTVNIKGPEGQPGQTGATPDISIGTVETLPPGSPATATMTGTAENPVLSFGIPQGQQGAPGEVTQAEFDDLADEVSQQKSAIEALDSLVDRKAGMLVDSVSGAVASFVPDSTIPDLLGVTVDIQPVLAGSGDPSPDNVRPISGWNAVSIWNKPTHDPTLPPTVTIQLGQTVYGDTLTIAEDGSVKALIDEAGVDLGTLNWKYQAASSVFYVDVPGKKAGKPVICSIYKPSDEYGFNVLDYELSTGRANNYVYVKDPRYTDVASFKAAVAGQTLVYMLDIPITIQLDPVTISTIAGQTNNVWADAGDVSVEFAADIKAYIDRLNQSPEDDMIANNLIASGKYFTVNNRLFLSTASIAAGAMIIPGTNCQETSLAAALNAINA